MIAEALMVKLGMDASGYMSEARKAARATDDIGDTARKTSKKGQGALGGMTGSLGKLGAAAAGAFAVGQLAGFAKDTVGAAADLAESVNATEVVFGSASATIANYGKTAATSVGLAQTQFNALATNSGALLTNFGFTQQQAADEAINLTERAADMASVFNTDVDEALFAVQAALRGETEPIRRFGVSLDDASIRAKAVEMGLAATTAEVTKNGKAQAALALVYDQTSKVQGDFANTSGSLANQQRILSAEWENAKAEIGQALIPLFTQLVGTVRNFMPALIDVGKGFADVVAAAGPLVDVLSAAIGPALQAVSGYLNLVADGTTSLLSLFGNDAATASLRFSESLEAVEKAAADGTDQAAAFANGLTHMARAGTLTAEQVSQLGDATEFVGEQQAVALLEARNWAQENGVAADQVRVLEEALWDQLVAMSDTGEVFEDTAAELGLLDLWQEKTAESAEALGEAGGDAADGVGEIEGAAEDAADGMAAAEKGAADLADQLAAAAAEQKSLTDVLKAAADPAFAAVRAYQSYQEVLAAVDEDGQRTAEEQLELAEAMLEAQSALDSFDAGNVDDAAQSIAEALDISTDAAKDLLRELGILDGQNVTTVVTTEFRATRSGAVLDSSDQAELARFANIRSGRQHGGDVLPTGVYPVGEDGPELFWPDSAGRVLNARQLAMAMPSSGAVMSGGGAVSGGGGSAADQSNHQATFNFYNSRLADDPMEAVRSALAFDRLGSLA